MLTVAQCSLSVGHVYLLYFRDRAVIRVGVGGNPVGNGQLWFDRNRGKNFQRFAMPGLDARHIDRTAAIEAERKDRDNTSLETVIA